MGLLTRKPTATVTFPDGRTFSTTDRHAPPWAVVGKDHDGRWHCAEWLLDDADRAAKLRDWRRISGLEDLRVQPTTGGRRG